MAIREAALLGQSMQYSQWSRPHAFDAIGFFFLLLVVMNLEVYIIQLTALKIVLQAHAHSRI